MDTEQVSVGIEQLVDHLRTNRSTAVTLGDIAGVTEVLLATMRRYFNSIDTTLYSEFRGLSEYIDRARGEIAELRPNDLKQEKIPRAGLELEAIVASTEEATGTIMDAAEEIMSADATADDYGDAVNDACMRIFEACSFQDITGQRITKVVATLTYIEERLHGLQDAWGPDIEDAEGEAAEAGKDKDARPDSDLLNGPALDGEGIAQNQVDDLLTAEFDAPASVEPAEAAAEIIEVEVDPALEPEPEAVAEVEPASDPVVDAAAKFLNGGADVVEPADEAEPTEDASQDDIDAMFGSDAAVEEAAPEVEPEPEPEPAPEPEPEAGPEINVAANGTGSEDPVADASADGDQPDLDDIVPLSPDLGETASQDDIDALFD